MGRSWKKITVLPVGRNTTPWLEDEEWMQALTLVLERMEENQRRWLMGLLGKMRKANESAHPSPGGVNGS